MAPKVASPRSKRSSEADSSAALFTRKACKGERTVVTLYAFGNESHDGVTVVAVVWSTYTPEGREPQRQFHVFPTREKADQFAEETLTALEYIGCDVS